ncbi:hypothetical protein Lepto7375DRAFT_1285 [Leptolyngbya sp. PCC 7375]|nr:hypothetical protein Lepto7375DRAFT_1285 [Leptolyngbya sp. PCC 7375]
MIVNTDTLETLAAQLSSDAALIQTLLEIANDNTPKLQTPNTWLLKRFQENGFSFSLNQMEIFLKLLREATHWQAKLHLLQMLSGFQIPAKALALK